MEWTHFCVLVCGFMDGMNGHVPTAAHSFLSGLNTPSAMPLTEDVRVI